MGGMNTPMFLWEEGDDKYDAEAFNYPYTRNLRKLPLQIETVRDLEEICERVSSVLKVVQHDCGNIVMLIAKDLASAAGAEERELLPKLDYMHVYFAKDITDQCKDMMRDKIKRYQRQHAHELAEAGMIDVCISWKREKLDPDAGGADYKEKRMVMVPENEVPVMQQVQSYHYKDLDWDEENYKDPKGPEPRRRGGFFACIPIALYTALVGLSPAWAITVDRTVSPKHMSAEEKEEMGNYHVARKAKAGEILAKAEQKTEEAAAEGEEEGHGKRKSLTYPKILQGNVDRFMRLNVNASQGAMWS